MSGSNLATVATIFLLYSCHLVILLYIRMERPFSVLICIRQMDTVMKAYPEGKAFKMNNVNQHTHMQM